MAGSSASGQERNVEKLTTEEEVFLMNIDYFEQWDRVHQKFNVPEKDVLMSMKAHNIRML